MNGMDRSWEKIEKAASQMVEKSGKQGLTEAQKVDRFLQTPRGRELYAEHQGSMVVRVAKGYQRAGYSMAGAEAVVKSVRKAKVKKAKRPSVRKEQAFYAECRRLHDVAEAEKRGERRGIAKIQAQLERAGVDLSICER